MIKAFFSLHIEGLRDSAKKAGEESNSPDQRNLVKLGIQGLFGYTNGQTAFFSIFMGEPNFC